MITFCWFFFSSFSIFDKYNLFLYGRLWPLKFLLIMSLSLSFGQPVYVTLLWDESARSVLVVCCFQVCSSGQPSLVISCLNFWDEAWWFLSLMVFGLLSSFLLLFLQSFGRYVLVPFSGVCRNWEPTRNFELRPLLNPRGSPVLIPLAITGYKC